MRTAFASLSVALMAALVVAAPVPKQKGEEPATDEQRKEVENNLKQIVLAMHIYCGANRSVLPDDIRDANSKPLLSWRAALLPDLGEGKLYREFKLDEAWDGETNKKLIEKLPKIYAPTRVRAGKGETFYRGFGGKGKTAGIFEPGKRVKVTAIPDGLSNTIGVIDAGEPVEWTKPGTDLDPDAKEFPKLGRMIDGDYFFCAIMDGSLRKVKRDFDEKAMKAAISRAGGEVFDEASVFVK